MVFALPARQAIAKVEEHIKVVLKELQRRHPKKQLHEIPFKSLLITTNSILLRHPDFKFTRHRLWPNKRKRELYSPYEIGHHLMIRRLVSQLKAEGHLNQEHTKLFMTALGELYYNPPVALIKREKQAFERLVKKKGKQRVDELLLEARTVWLKHGEEKRLADQSYTEQEQKKDKLSDIFSNPYLHKLLVFADFTHGGPVEACRRIFKESIAVYSGPNTAHYLA